MTKNLPRYLILCVALLGAAALGWWYGSRHIPPTQTSETPAEASARVTTQTIVRAPLREELELMGEVLPRVSSQHNYSLPYESSVVKVLVARGQRVQRRDTLLLVKDSPGASLELQSAERALHAAEDELNIAEQRQKSGLETKQSLLLRRKSVADAKAQYERMLAGRSVQGLRSVKAFQQGVVAQILVHPGDLVAAGTPLLQVIDRNTIQVRLWAEVEDIDLIKVGMPVQVSPAERDPLQHSEGQIVSVLDTIDPKTRLVEVLANVANDAGLMLNQFVRASVVVETRPGLIIPRRALVTDEGRYRIFIDANGRAKAFSVQLAQESGPLVMIQSLELQPALKAGARVIVQGAYQVKDGMPLVIEAASTTEQKALPKSAAQQAPQQPTQAEEAP